MDKLYQKHKLFIHTFLLALFIGFIVHGYVLSNKFVNADDIDALNRVVNLPTSGRWFLWLPFTIKGTASAPWSVGVMSLVYLALAVSFTVECFRLRSIGTRGIMAMIMVTFPVVCSSFAYMAYSSAYFFALALAAGSTFIADRYKYGYVVAIPIVIILLAIYQAYFAVAAALMLGILFMDVLNGMSVRDILVKDAKFALTLGASMAIYLIVTRFMVNEIVDYMSMDQMGRITPSELPAAIKNSFARLFEYYFMNQRGFHTTRMKIAFVLLAISGLAMLRCKLSRLPILIIIGIGFLMSSNLIEIMVPRFDDKHLLMVYAMVMPLVLLVALIEKCGVKWLAAVTSVLLIFTSYNYFILTNQAYLYMNLLEKQNGHFSSRLVQRIEGMEGYKPSDIVILVGEAKRNIATGNQFENLDQIAGIARNMAKEYNYGDYLANFVGFSNTVSVLGDMGALSQFAIDELSEMPEYPADGSIKYIDNCIFVKFE